MIEEQTRLGFQEHDLFAGSDPRGS